MKTKGLLLKNKINHLPEVILERDKERRVLRSKSTQAMSNTVAAQKQTGPLGSQFNFLANPKGWILVLNLFLISNFVFAGYKRGSEPAGFRDIQWGTDLSSLTGMTPDETGMNMFREYIDINLRFYTRRNDNLQIDGARVKNIGYGFYKKKFYDVLIVIDGVENFEKLKNVLNQKFGKGEHLNVFNCWYWLGKRTIMFLKYSKSLNQGVFCITSTKIQKQMLKDFQREGGVVFKKAIEKAKNEKLIYENKKNLRRIGMAARIYSPDHMDKLPDRLSSLFPHYLTSLEVFVSPASKGKTIKKEEIDKNSDYLWLGAGLIERRAKYNSILACDRKGIFQGGRCVLFFDCTIEWMSEGEFQELLKRQRHNIYRGQVQ